MAHAVTSSVATHLFSAPAKCWAPATGAAVNVDRLTMRRGDRDVLRDLSLAFEEGAVTAIVGPSGVGKTTLICALNGLLGAASGAVSIGGLGRLNDAAVLREARRRTATVFQDHALIGRLRP